MADASSRQSASNRYSSIVEETPQLAARIVPALPFIYADLLLCARDEMAVHLSDLLRRRMPLLILATTEHGRGAASGRTGRAGDGLGCGQDCARGRGLLSMIVAVALDLGTTTIKAGLLSQDGTLGGVVARPAPRITADGGRYESDARAYAATADAVLSECLAQTEVRPRHGGAEPSGAGAGASHFLPQTADFVGNVSEVRPRHGGAEPSGAGAGASHFLPQTADFVGNAPARGRPMGSPLLCSDPFARRKCARRSVCAASVLPS